MTSDLTSFYQHSKYIQLKSGEERSLLTDQAIKTITLINHRRMAINAVIHY